MKARKNKKRIDPRYHLDETIDQIEEESNATRQQRMKDFHNFSFETWLNEGLLEDIFEESETLEEITVDMRSPKVGEDDEELEMFPGGTVADLPPEVVDDTPGACGAGKEPKLFFVDLGLLGKLEAPALKGAINFALHAIKNDLPIEDMSPEIAAAVQGLREETDLGEG